jgi:hypothetical protein
MRRPALLPCLALAALSALAQDGAAPPAGDCARALQSLRADEDAAAQARRAGESTHHAALQRLQAQRERAAQACLQGRADAPVPAPQRPAVPPMSVPPLAYPAPVVPRPAPVPTLPVPPARAAAPTSITSCDALGCWASDGTRLQRAGPGLLGPRGFCSAPGGLLSCP